MKKSAAQLKTPTSAATLLIGVALLMGSCTKPKKPPVRIYAGGSNSQVVGATKENLRNPEAVQIRHAGNYVDGSGTFHESHRTFRVVKENTWNLGFQDPGGRQRLAPIPVLKENKNSPKRIPSRGEGANTPAKMAMGRGSEMTSGTKKSQKIAAGPRKVQVDPVELEMLKSLKQINAQLLEHQIVVDNLIKKANSAEGLLSSLHKEVKSKADADSLKKEIVALEKRLVETKESVNKGASETTENLPMTLVWKSIN